MNASTIRWMTGLCLVCAVTIGCSSGSERLPGSGHEALLREYQSIADQGLALVTANPPTDPAVVANVKKLAQKVMDLTHRKLTVSQPPTPEQAARYAAVSATFQKVLKAACPNCPK